MTSNKTPSRTTFFTVLAVVAVCAFSFAQSSDQDPVLPASFYATGTWDADSLGNHRVVLQISGNSEAVTAHIPWRRRDHRPEDKGIWIVNGTTGKRIRNASWTRVTRESGDVIFEPSSGPGLYYVYYLLYRHRGSRNYPRGYYLPPDTVALRTWSSRFGDASRELFDSLPKARVVRFESIDEFNSFYPMEVIARADELTRLLEENPGKEFLVFPEARTNSIRMTHDVPAKWISDGANKELTLRADRGEYLTFQIGLFAARNAIRDVDVSMTEPRDSRGNVLPASSFTCFNTEGIDWTGRSMDNVVSVAQGCVQSLWMGFEIPQDTPPGEYTAVVTTSPAGMSPQASRITVTVSEQTVAFRGDDEPERLSRLRWLNSQIAADDDLVAPFTPLELSELSIRCLGRTVTLDESGMIGQIRSSFTPEVTGLGQTPRDMLAAPVRMVIEAPDGSTAPWTAKGVTFTEQAPGAVGWVARAHAGPFDAELKGRMEMDGFVDFQVSLSAQEDARIEDIRLEVPMVESVARYMMGMGVRGGVRPPSFEWTWEVGNNQDAVWLGDVNAGFQLSFRDENYERPLNTNFYLLKPLQMPPSWYNQGKGGFRFEEKQSGVLLLESYSGPREVKAGETLHFNYSFLVTPFKIINTDAQWKTRYYHRYEPLETIAQAGANTINVHHATPINPYINYPFFRPDEMKAYIDSAHARDFKVKIYYTVRELANRAPELFMLRSLGEEILSGGPGGGFSWLQEHLDSNYIAAWFVPDLKDAAVINSGVSRWHNFYVEGLAWLVRNVGIDGLYIDDVAFDRTTMKRVRKVLDRGRPGSMIDLHSANQFNVRDGFANSANLYLEHFPYIDRLWFGEYFDYGSSPDFWLVETSGIPFGLMGEMLEKGGNPWRGMLYGMTSRLPWAGDPRPIWGVWDEFGMEGSEMIGYFSGDCPVHTDHDSVLATVYRKEGMALVALASWEPEPVDVQLVINWKALGIDPDRATVFAPAVRDFQAERRFGPNERIPVEPGKGWLLVVSEQRR
jgi:hypothetical protein